MRPAIMLKALKTYFQQGPPADWQSRHVSAYASAHPWEDWAETWAHYFHIVDTVETAGSFGIVLTPQHPSAQTRTANPKNVAAFDANFDTLLENWFPLTYALNSLNRSMGPLDLYPSRFPTRPSRSCGLFIAFFMIRRRAHGNAAPDCGRAIIAPHDPVLFYDGFLAGAAPGNHSGVRIVINSTLSNWSLSNSSWTKLSWMNASGARLARHRPWFQNWKPKSKNTPTPRMPRWDACCSRGVLLKWKSPGRATFHWRICSSFFWLRFYFHNFSDGMSPNNGSVKAGVKSCWMLE